MLLQRKAYVYVNRANAREPGQAELIEGIHTQEHRSGGRTGQQHEERPKGRRVHRLVQCSHRHSQSKDVIGSHIFQVGVNSATLNP